MPLVLLAYRMPGYHDPDYAAAEIAFDVLQSPRSDFSGLVYSGKALQTGAEYDPQPQAGLGFTYIAIQPGGDTAAALRTLDDVVKAYQTHGAPADLVEAQKKREIAQDLFSRNSIEGLANDWSQAVAIQGLNSPDDMIALFNKVTPDDVTRVFRRYFVRVRPSPEFSHRNPAPFPLPTARSASRTPFHRALRSLCRSRFGLHNCKR